MGNGQWSPAALGWVGTVEGDEIEVDMAAGTIRNITKGLSFTVPPFPQELLDIIQAGGLMSYVKQQAGQGS